MPTGPTAGSHGPRSRRERMRFDFTFDRAMKPDEVKQIEGMVQQWIDAYGDPRQANVDPVDWVERIPFSETRNYVQRILENIQVYRVRFGGSSRLMIEADIHRGAGTN